MYPRIQMDVGNLVKKSKLGGTAYELQSRFNGRACTTDCVHRLTVIYFYFFQRTFNGSPDAMQIHICNLSKNTCLLNGLNDQTRVLYVCSAAQTFS